MTNSVLEAVLEKIRLSGKSAAEQLSLENRETVGVLGPYKNFDILRGPQEIAAEAEKEKLERINSSAILEEERKQAQNYTNASNVIYSKYSYFVEQKILNTSARWTYSDAQTFNSMLVERKDSGVAKFVSENTWNSELPEPVRAQIKKDEEIAHKGGEALFKARILEVEKGQDISIEEAQKQAMLFAMLDIELTAAQLTDVSPFKTGEVKFEDIKPEPQAAKITEHKVNQLSYQEVRQLTIEHLNTYGTGDVSHPGYAGKIIQELKIYTEQKNQEKIACIQQVVDKINTANIAMGRPELVIDTARAVREANYNIPQPAAANAAINASIAANQTTNFDVNKTKADLLQTIVSTQAALIANPDLKPAVTIALQEFEKKFGVSAVEIKNIATQLQGTLGIASASPSILAPDSQKTGVLGALGGQTQSSSIMGSGMTYDKETKIYTDNKTGMLYQADQKTGVLTPLQPADVGKPLGATAGIGGANAAPVAAAPTTPTPTTTAPVTAPISAAPAPTEKPATPTPVANAPAAQPAFTPPTPAPVVTPTTGQMPPANPTPVVPTASAAPANGQVSPPISTTPPPPTTSAQQNTGSPAPQNPPSTPVAPAAGQMPPASPPTPPESRDPDAARTGARNPPTSDSTPAPVGGGGADLPQTGGPLNQENPPQQVRDVPRRVQTLPDGSNVPAPDISANSRVTNSQGPSH